MQENKYLLIPPGEVHVWIARLSDSRNDWKDFASLLSSNEHERASNYRFSKDKRNFIIARGILRALLARYLKKSPQNIQIVYSPWGKPYLLEELEKNQLSFNVSHSKDYVLYAFTINHEVGIDLEYINKNFDLENMTLSIFSPVELNYWKGLCYSKRIESFFKFWVGAEAYLKAIGRGWLDEKKLKPLGSFFPHNQLLIDESLKDKITYPYFFNIIPGYASALFVDGPSLKVSYYHWHADGL